MTCNHSQANWLDETGFWCPDCKRWLVWDCEECGGDGLVHADEWHGDFVNYDSTLIPCPSCNGTGQQKADDFDWSIIED